MRRSDPQAIKPPLLICIPVPRSRFVSTSPGQDNLVSPTKQIMCIRPGINHHPQGWEPIKMAQMGGQEPEGGPEGALEASWAEE